MKYKLRNGIICRPWADKDGWMRILVKPRKLDPIDRDILLLRHGSPNPLKWTGGGLGDQFDVIEKVEKPPKSRKPRWENPDINPWNI